jgi:hypothetical protein
MENHHVFMGKSPISMAIFNSYVNVYQRVDPVPHVWVSGFIAALVSGNKDVPNQTVLVCRMFQHTQYELGKSRPVISKRHNPASQSVDVACEVWDIPTVLSILQ